MFPGDTQQSQELNVKHKQTHQLPETEGSQGLVASPDSCSIFFFKVGPTFPMKSKITFILYGPFHLPPFFFFSTYHLLKEVLLITLQLKTVKQVNNVTLELRIKPSKIPPLSLTPLLSLIFFFQASMLFQALDYRQRSLHFTPLKEACRQTVQNNVAGDLKSCSLSLQDSVYFALT